MNTWSLGDWTVVVDSVTALAYNPVLLHQVHGATITHIDHFVAQRPTADGVITSGQVPVGILTADCLPLIITTSHAAAALHISRASLVAGLLNQLPEHLELNAIEHIFIGPHICEQHLMYEEYGPSLQAFAARFPDYLTKRHGRYHVGLRQAVVAQLAKWQTPGLVTCDERCTYEDLTLGSHKRLLTHPDGPLPHQITAVLKSTGPSLRTGE